MKLSYRPELDGLRAVAILAVLGFHLFRPVFGGGFLGVDVFFVLSGYLITSILAAEAELTGRIDYRDFLLRRARRLWPALLLLLAAYVAVTPLFWPQLADRRWFDAGTAALYATNLRQTFAPFETPLAHTWSLAIEEQFYILWPLALPALLRLPRPIALRWLLGAWAAVTLVRAACPPTFSTMAYFFTPLHASGLLLGCALALRPIRVHRGELALAALVPLTLCFRGMGNYPFITPLAELLAVLIIADPPKLLSTRPLRFIGKISYGVYLWHIPLAWALGFPKTLVGICPLVALSLLAGWASHVAVERWFLRPRAPCREIVPAAG